MKIIGIIPARLSSSRFPGKPMKKIHGMPMIGHCYFRSKMSSILDDVFVATCDQEICDYIGSIGGEAIMTSDTHQRASDRTAEAVKTIENNTGEKIDIVVMLQGDEPMITPGMIESAVTPLLKDPEVLVSNLMAEMSTRKEHEDPNEVKVVVDKNNNALYFSREPIPSRKKGAESIKMLKQVCVIPFRKDFLIEYTQMKPTPLEIIESVDMLRILENGYDVRMILSTVPTFAVDTNEDLLFVQEQMKGDELMTQYLN